MDASSAMVGQEVMVEGGWSFLSWDLLVCGDWAFQENRPVSEVCLGRTDKHRDN